MRCSSGRCSPGAPASTLRTATLKRCIGTRPIRSSTRHGPFIGHFWFSRRALICSQEYGALEDRPSSRCLASEAQARAFLLPAALCGGACACGVSHTGAPPRASKAGQEQSAPRSEEHTSELQSPCNLVCRVLLETT